MKPDLILSAIIMLTLIFVTWTILNTVMQPKEIKELPCMGKFGHRMPQTYCDAQLEVFRDRDEDNHK